jgi:hypothetical protein
LHPPTDFLHPIVRMIGKIDKAADEQQPADQAQQSCGAHAAHGFGRRSPNEGGRCSIPARTASI